MILSEYFLGVSVSADSKQERYYFLSLEGLLGQKICITPYVLTNDTGRVKHSIHRCYYYF
jgi:hypothetical protein